MRRAPKFYNFMQVDGGGWRSAAALSALVVIGTAMTIYLGTLRPLLPNSCFQPSLSLHSIVQTCMRNVDGGFVGKIDPLNFSTEDSGVIAQQCNAAFFRIHAGYGVLRSLFSRSYCTTIYLFLFVSLDAFIVMKESSC